MAEEAKKKTKSFSISDATKSMHPNLQRKVRANSKPRKIGTLRRIRMFRSGLLWRFRLQIKRRHINSLFNLAKWDIQKVASQTQNRPVLSNDQNHAWLHKFCLSLKNFFFNQSTQNEKPISIPRQVKIVVVCLGLFVLLSFCSLHHLNIKSLSTPQNSPATTLDTDLQNELSVNPTNAETMLGLGHVLFVYGQHASALPLYNKALEQEKGIADRRLVDNLVACFGTEAQNKAANLIAKYKIYRTETKLREFLSSRSRKRSVRAKALQTLEKLKRVTRTDLLTFFLLDLRAKKCSTRLRAVKKLGYLGEKRTITALYAAKRRDITKPAYKRSTCLGKSVERSIQRIRRKLR